MESGDGQGIVGNGDGPYTQRENMLQQKLGDLSPIVDGATRLQKKKARAAPNGNEILVMGDELNSEEDVGLQGGGGSMTAGSTIKGLLIDAAHDFRQVQ